MPMFKFNRTNKVLRPDGAIEKVSPAHAEIWTGKGWGEVIEPDKDLTPPADDKADEEAAAKEAAEEAAADAAAEVVTTSVPAPPIDRAVRNRSKRITRNRNR